MKDTLYTIPLTDAFKAEDECPFCFIYRNLEQDAISFTLGASYMEDDIREKTDALGFCKEHYKKLYDYGNRLGLAFILQTHYVALQKTLKSTLSHTRAQNLSLLQKLKKGPKVQSASTHTPATQKLNDTLSSCYVCSRIDYNFDRYIKTFFYLLTTNEEFKTLFINSKGFCLPHFTKLLEEAPYHLKEKDQTFFLEESQKKLQESLARIEEDLSWFIDKYDYRNSAAPWKNAKDAIPRGIQKLSGIYVQDEPFKETK